MKEKIRAAVIGASAESVPVINKAKKMGLWVVALDGDPDAAGLGEADAAHVVDIMDLEQVYKMLGPAGVRLVLPVPVGRCLTTIGAVNDRYGLCGVSQRTAALCTDKWTFHMMLHGEGLREAEACLISAGEPFSREVFDNTGFSENSQVVVKPRFGSGSRQVRVFPSFGMLRRELTAQLPFSEDFIMETYVPGKEYGVDGAFVNSKFQLILLREKILTSLPYCQCVGYYSIAESEENTAFFQAVRRLMKETGECFQMRDCLVHADIIRGNDDRPFLVEISARPSGHYLSGLFTTLATGVDMTKEYIKQALPELGYTADFVPDNVKCMLIRYFDFSGCRIKKLPDEEQLKRRYPLAAYRCNMREGMELGKVVDGASIMGRGYYILEGADRGDLMKNAAAIENEFVLEKRWGI